MLKYILKKLPVVPLAIATLIFSGSKTMSLELGKIFSDNMVLQRDLAVPIWGWGRAGEVVTVTFKDRTASAVVDDQGLWSLSLDPLAASSLPACLTVSSEAATKVFNNVLVGDVWLCSGQSNMEESFNYKLESEYPPGQEIAAELKKIDNAQLRIANPMYRDVGEGQSRAKVVPVPSTHSAFPYSGWKECNSKTAKRFSRVGYYFGNSLQQQLEIPIGLINISMGCSSIEAWMPPEAFASSPQLAQKLEEMKSFQDFYRNYTSMSGNEREPILLEHCASPYGAFARMFMKNGKLPVENQDKVLDHMTVIKPASLYYHSIHPLIPFAVKGVIWYQGETNLVAADKKYALKQQALIESWRQLWNQGDFHFYIVLLAPCGDGKNRPLPEFWLQQYAAADKTANCGLVAAVDIGDFNQAHPKNKQDVGQRLALLALQKAYGQKNVVASGPTYQSMKIAGSDVIISFDNIGTGLKTSDGKAPSWFEIAGVDRKFVDATAKIQGNVVVVSNPLIQTPVFVRYAWSSMVQTNFCNQQGLPALPFNTAEKPLDP